MIVVALDSTIGAACGAALVGAALFTRGALHHISLDRRNLPEHISVVTVPLNNGIP